MTDYPDLTIGVCSYARPWYTTIALMSLKSQLVYSGRKIFHVVGKDDNQSIDLYRKIVKGYGGFEYTRADNLSVMCNTIAQKGGEVWLTTLDDYALRYPVDITPDVQLLRTHPEIGCIRLACLSFWGSSGKDPETNADLIGMGGLHWWRLDKARTKDSYASGIFCHLYHRRFWDCYGDIPACPPDNPGQAELLGRERFNNKPDGVTIAVPMRFGEDTVERPEPFWHFGTWHADDYARYAGSRIRGL